MNRHLERLDDLHPDLARVILNASKIKLNFVVTEGLRSIARQKELVAHGASQTMRSRHLDGHAVDLAVTVGEEIRWDWPLYADLAEIVKAAAKEEGVALEWGGDWKTLKDGPHFQLPWDRYPSDIPGIDTPLVS